MLTLPLRVTAADERALQLRLEAGRQVYNAMLGEALRTLDLMRTSPEWRIASTTHQTEERSRRFAAACRLFEFKKARFDRLAIRCKNACWFGDHLGPHEVQQLAKRAFRAVQQHAFGVRGRPRFKGRGHGLHSLEGKSNAAGIYWRTNAVLWKGLTLPAMIDARDTDGYQRDALGRRILKVRVVRRELRGRTRWYVQLVLDGHPPPKRHHALGAEHIGLDMGPSTLAAVGQSTAVFTRFCPAIEQPWTNLRRLRRALERSRRATNPDNYAHNGTNRRGQKQWRYSGRYRRARQQVAEIERRLRKERRRAHGELANQLLTIGTTFTTERLSYRAWQRSRYGKSLHVRAPGMFLQILRRKAASAGGWIREVPTRSTCLSRTCHCGRVVRKPLALRFHACPCGVGPVQRDLYSAYLARHLREDHTLDAHQADVAWSAAEPLLRRAASSFTNLQVGRALPVPRVAGTGPATSERVARQTRQALVEGSYGTVTVPA